jgi:hypothetical protein
MNRPDPKSRRCSELRYELRYREREPISFLFPEISNRKLVEASSRRNQTVACNTGSIRTSLELGHAFVYGYDVRTGTQIQVPLGEL